MKESDERLDKKKAESDQGQARQKVRGTENWAVNMVRMRMQRERERVVIKTICKS